MPILTPDYSNINYEEMAQAIGLKVKHMPMLIGSFLDESAPILETLQSSIEGRDYPAIKAEAHSIKGSAGNLRFNEIYEMAKEMEYSATDANAEFDYMGYLEAIKSAISTISL